MDRRLEKESFSEGNAEFQQDWEKATNSEIRGGREGRSGQVQQQFESNNNLPYQQDYQSYQPLFYSQPQPKPHSTFHSSSFQDPHYNSQPYFTENDQKFFQNQSSLQNFQIPSYDPFPQFQNQEPFFYPQPHAQSQTEHGYYPQSYPMEFQQEEHQVGDPQPPILSEDAAAFAAILEALKPNSEWFLKREEEEKEFLSVMQEAGFPWRNSEEAMKENREEEENEFTLVEAQEWSLEVEEWETGANEERFREKEELEQEEKEERLLQHVEGKEMSMEEDAYHLYPMFRKGEELIAYSPCEGGIFLQSTHEQQKEEVREEKELAAVQYTWLEEGREDEENKDELESLLLQSALAQQQRTEEKEKLEGVNDLSLLLRNEKAIADLACELHPQSAYSYQETQQQWQQEGYERKEEERRLPTVDHFSLLFSNKKVQQQEEGGKKQLDAFQYTLLEGEKEATMKKLTCADLDILVHKVHHLMQHGTSIKEAGETVVSCQLLSPHSMKPLSTKEKDVEDFTSSDFDTLLHEDNSIKDGQHPTQGEKQEEGRRITPDLLKYEASELHLPQATTPRRKEAAAYPFMFKCFSPDFELTSNKFFLSLSMFISGDKLKVQQLLLIHFCKLQSIALLGDVHKKGARGDGVPWFIKVHPP